MAYDVNNSNYQELTDYEKEFIGLDEQERCKAMENVLNDLDDDELMDMFRKQNSWDGSFPFCDGWDMDEFLSAVIEGKNGSDLVSFILEVAQAINEYDGYDYESARWGYFDGYTLEIKDNGDMVDDARYCVDELADLIVTGNAHIDDVPSEVEDVLSLWDMEDNEDFLYEDED